jgi:hypothetical protein
LEDLDESILIPFHSFHIIGTKVSAIDRNIRDIPTFNKENYQLLGLGLLEFEEAS